MKPNPDYTLAEIFAAVGRGVSFVLGCLFFPLVWKLRVMEDVAHIEENTRETAENTRSPWSDD